MAERGGMRGINFHRVVTTNLHSNVLLKRRHRSIPMTCYVHHVPGRLRVRVPAAKDNATNAVRLVTRLNTLEGITSVAANEVTGSILIRYDTTAFDPAACL